MHDEFDEFGRAGGLTEFASAPGTTQVQAPYCPIPARVEPVDLWGYRWADFTTEVTPQEYRVVKQMEYRIPGAGSYEVTIREDTAWFQDAAELPIGTRTGLQEGPSGIARIRVTSGNLDVGRFHSGRATLVVTGEKISVEFLLPVRAVSLKSQPVPAVTATTSDFITVSEASIRVVGVPARSRKPSQWRICDWVTISNAVVFLPTPLAPGVSDIIATGTEVPNPGTAGMALFATSSIIGPSVRRLAVSQDWHPVDCATHYTIFVGGGLPAFRTFIVTQRGWI